ncbi:hypothetical protein V8C35DRAFT_289206 [Trichoderma chlorosporum]
MNRNVSGSSQDALLLLFSALKLPLGWAGLGLGIRVRGFHVSMEDLRMQCVPLRGFSGASWGWNEMLSRPRFGVWEVEDRTEV